MSVSRLRCIRFIEIRFVDASKTLLLQMIYITPDTSRWRHNRRYRISSHEDEELKHSGSHMHSHHSQHDVRLCTKK